VPGNHVDDRSRHEERRNAARAAVRQFGVGVLDHRQAADARADNATDAASLLFAQCLAHGQTGIGHGLRRSGNPVVDEGVHGARLFGADVGLQVEALDLAGDLAGEVGSIELGDQVNA
jgi:hypothetical protein